MGSTETGKAVTRDAVPSTIASRLSELIAAGRFAPGMRLGQSELATQFESSRVPVREALKMLSAEGLVEHDPNRGFFVARFSTDEARQLFRIRDLIENELLESLEWPDPEQLADIARHGEELEELLNSGSRTLWWKRHREFQEKIFNLSRQKIFVREAMRLWVLTDRYRALAPLPRRASAERDIVNKNDIVEALRLKDRKLLKAAREKRRNAFRELVLEILENRGL